jgi:predicted transcriptional regulator of viral defense system
MARPAKNVDSSAREVALDLFKQHDGMLKTARAIRLGIHPRTLYRLRDEGEIEPVVKGLFRLKDLPPFGNPDLVTVSLAIPKGVICLVSALSFHGVGTQIPHEVNVALLRGSSQPRLEYPPIHLYWFAGEAFTEGVAEHSIDNMQVRVYGIEKTIADCFKYRNRIGLDVCLEALKDYRAKKKFNVDLLMHYCRICRVEKVIRPYMETLL